MNPLPDDVQNSDSSVDLRLEIKEQADLIRAAIGDLTELTRLVFHLRVTEDLSFKEIAKLADITEVAARQHMHQAHQTAQAVRRRVFRQAMKCEAAQEWLLQCESLQPKSWPRGVVKHLRVCTTVTNSAKE